MPGPAPQMSHQRDRDTAALILYRPVKDQRLTPNVFRIAARAARELAPPVDTPPPPL